MSLYVLYFFVVSLFFAFLYLLTKNKKTKKNFLCTGKTG